jgi:hypothetical protein
MSKSLKAAIYETHGIPEEVNAIEGNIQSGRRRIRDGGTKPVLSVRGYKSLISLTGTKW